MGLVPYLVPTELYKAESFAIGLLANFGPMVKLAATLEASIQVTKSFEDIVNRKTINQTESEIRGLMKDPQNPKKNSRLSKTKPQQQVSWGKQRSEMVQKMQNKVFWTMHRRCDLL